MNAKTANNEFRHDVMKQLTDQQVRFAPPARRFEQLVRAQKLLSEIDPSRNYPYQFVCFRITDYRTDVHQDALIVGGDLSHDLELFVKRVERSIPPLPIEQVIEPILTLEEVSRQFNVSTKTVGRWRMRGLVGKRVIIHGRIQLGFYKSTVEQFLANNQERIARSGRFSHLTDAEKERILRMAKDLAVNGTSLMEASREIAKILNRSVEAVRYTIRHYDEQHPEQGLFTSLPPKLDSGVKDLIFDSYRRGIPVETLAKQYGRTRSSMYRVINEVRADKLINQPLDYIPNADFDDASRDAEFSSEMPGETNFLATRLTMKAPKDVPAELASLYEWPLLTKEQEQHQFRKMNYLKHKVHQLRQKIDPNSVRVQDLEKLESLQNQIGAVKDRLINCNMRLVASIAKKHSAQSENLFDLISDGNISLMRAVEKFDYARGNKFSTYASWAIMKNFARSIPDEKTHKERYVTGNEEIFDARADMRTDEHEQVAKAEQAKDRISSLLATLDPRTRDVIRMRNGLDGNEEMTLEQIGQYFGITKERVRQINVRGMKLLREKVEKEQVELP